MGNGEAKELICMTHGHELRWGNAGGGQGTRQRGIKGREKWDNYNSIINKIYFKKHKLLFIDFRERKKQRNINLLFHLIYAFIG